MSLPPKSERARGPKDKFRVQNTYILFGPGELATTSSYRDNARDDVIFEHYRSLPCGVIESQSMTRECHANCNKRERVRENSWKVLFRVGSVVRAAYLVVGVDIGLGLFIYTKQTLKCIFEVHCHIMVCIYRATAWMLEPACFGL